jgi:TonB family protein
MTTAIAQALSAALLHFVWQGLLVAFVLWVALFLLRNRTAHSRYLASCIALVVLALLPAVTAFILYAKPAPAAEFTLTASAVPVAPAESKREASPQPWLAAWQSWAVPVWSLGVLLFSIRLVWGCKQVSSLRRRGTPAEASILTTVSNLATRLGIARRVSVLMTSVADGPSVVGWIRPVVLLPSATLLGLTPEQLEAVLAHELAHIRRHDYIVNVMQILLETLLFYHPAVWWISARIRDERELCCDDLAVSSCGDALCYARALTKLERLRVAAPQLAMAGTGGPLLYRIQRLIGAKKQEYGPSKLPGIVALSLGLACFAINVHWAKGQSQDQPKAGRYVFINDGRGYEQDAAGVTVDPGSGAILRRASVEYPRRAVEKGIQGTVTVEATIDAAGDVSDARVVSGPSELRRSVLQSVLEWHFPADASGSTRVRQINVAFDSATAQKHAPEEASQPATTDIPVGTRLRLEAGRYTVTSDGPKMFELRSDVRPNVGWAVNRNELTNELARTNEEQERLDEVRAQIRELERKIEAEPVISNDTSEPAISKSLEAQISELRAKLAASEPYSVVYDRNKGVVISNTLRNTNRDPSEQERSANLEARAILAPPEPDASGEPSFLGRAVGHKLARINVAGYSDEARKSLISQLPVHIGDTITEESIESIGATIRNFDERQHLESKSRWTMQNVPIHAMPAVNPEGEAWVLQITAPNAGHTWKVDLK